MSGIQARIDAAFAQLTEHTGFTERPDQRQLAHLLGDCIEHGSRGAFEAPTGLGKSLASLIPAIAHALESGKRTVIATYTNVLAEQYWRTDLPLALSLFPDPDAVKSQFLIGRQRYACLASIAEAYAGTLKDFVRNAELGIETEFRQYVHKSPRETMQMWQGISTPPVCPAKLCPHFNNCFYYGARRGAEKAHVVITNHSVVIQDALLRRASGGDLNLLGDIDFLIIDEAHDFLQAAMSGLEFELNESKVAQIVNIAHRLQMALQVVALEAGEPHLWNQACDEYVELVTKLAMQIGDDLGVGILQATPLELSEHPQVKSRSLKDSLPTAQAISKAIAQATLGFVRTAERSLKAWSEGGYAGGDEHDAIRNYLMYLREFGEQCEMLLTLGSETSQVGVTYAAGGSMRAPTLRHDVVGLAEPLRELIWDRIPYACLSATLAVDGTFEFFRRSTGAQPDFEEILPSPFDYPSQAALYVPPSGRILDPAIARKEYREDEYHAGLAREIESILEATSGRALVLFHSRKEMEAVHQLIDKDEDRPIYIQRTGGTAATGEKFRTNISSSMFALRSFWTGFDAPGETLSCVVLVRVPFEVPIDPPAIARMAWMQSQGLDPFVDYTLPVAKMMIRQGAGRLLRRQEDRGIIALLDPRLRSKGYGEQFFENLPPGMRSFSDIYDAVAHVQL